MNAALHNGFVSPASFCPISLPIHRPTIITSPCSTSTMPSSSSRTDGTSSPHPMLARLEHMTFAWFTSSMSLGGIANLLLSRIIDSTGLYYLGLALFLLNIGYLLVLISLQFVRYNFTPASLTYTLTHPIECCFIPTALLAGATVINGFASVVGDAGSGWEIVLRTLFWIYFAASLVVSLVCYTCLFARAEQSLHHMNPAWVLPIFPLMLCGSVASAVLPTQSELSAFIIAICGLTCQGLGFTLSCMMYSVLLLRLMTVSFPPPRARPGLFMNCGPPAFTIICLMGLSSEMQRILPALPTQLPLPPSAYETLQVVALASSIFLWFISAWFYLLTVASLVHLLFDTKQRREMEFILAWWACVFPITGFATATNEIGEALASKAVMGVAKGMVVWLMVVFVGVAAMHARAVWRGGIMAEGKDEDRVIDTMYHRVELGGDGDAHGHGLADVEKGHAVELTHLQERQQQQQHHQQQQQEEEAASPYSNPPTYPSTPAVSVRRMSIKKDPQPQRSPDDDDVDNIQPLPPSSSSSSSSPSSTSTTPWSSQLRMTPLSSSP